MYDEMQQGMADWFYSIVGGITVYVGLMPIWNIIYGQWFVAWLAAQSTVQFTGGLSYILMGVQAIPFVIGIRVAIGAIHALMGGINQRVYQQSGNIDEQNANKYYR